MNRTARLATITATATLALALAGCGASDDNDYTPIAGSTAGAEVEEEVADEPTDESKPAALGEMTATAESGETYTVHAPIDVPAETRAIMEDAGIEQEKLDTAQLIPVDIDNANGTDPAGILGLFLVNEAGETIELTTLSEELFEASEVLPDDDWDRYERVWESFEDASVEVKPTAAATDYVVAYDLPADDKYTYVAVAGLGWMETPVLIA